MHRLHHEASDPALVETYAGSFDSMGDEHRPEIISDNPHLQGARP